MVDNCETSEAFEFLLTESVWVDGRRVGSFGGADCGGVRDGSGGGPGRPGEGPGDSRPFPFSWPVVRRGSGGASFSVAARAGPGRGGIAGLFSAMQVSGAGAVLFTASVNERTGGGGGGRFPATDGGALKFFCWLRAAMRSASVV